ncbi:hypothetical protein KR200_006183 [Drosophila serrata]|nr:hypothetical protein KR200_006183 [Drosophila serrata]
MRKMLVHVVTRDGGKTLYELDHFGTVAQLKARIGMHMAVPMGFSRLTYKGSLLENHSVLEEVGVKRMSTLLLYWQPLVFTPKQLREREDELDKLEELQRAGELLMQEADQEHEGGALDPGSGRSHKLHLSLASLTCSKLPDIEVEDVEDVTSISSSELDFLAVYRRPKNGNKSEDLIETEEEPLEPQEPLNPQEPQEPQEPVFVPPNDDLFRLAKDIQMSEEIIGPETKTVVLDNEPIASPSKGSSGLEQDSVQESSDTQNSKSSSRKKTSKKYVKKNRKNK